MEAKMPYQNLDHALRFLRVQVMEGIPFAQRELPKFTSPEHVFRYFKPRTRYKHDPNNTELFQSLPTLIDNNFHGITGAGDCDCFTIATLSALLANGFTDCGIVLVGRNKRRPVHIYTYVIDQNGKKKYLDLTNKYFDYERYYPYKQHIPFKLNPKEKAMMLQLADGGTKTDYIWMPSMGAHVREDYYDGMSAGEFQNLLLSEDFEVSEIIELSAKRAQRKAEKQTTKTAAKQEKKAAKPRTQKKAAKVEVKKAKAEKIKAKGAAAIERGKSYADRASKAADLINKVVETGGKYIGKMKGGEMIPADEETTDTETTTTDVVTKVIDKGGKYIGKVQGGKVVPPDDELEITIPDASEGTDKTPAKKSADKPAAPAPPAAKPKAADDEMMIFGKPVKKKTVYWGVGIGLTVLTIAGIAYTKTRSRRRAA